MNNQGNQTVSDQLEELIPKFWKRARINALAHRVAMNRSHIKDSISYILTVVTSLLSIFFIILGYITQIQTNDPSDILKSFGFKPLDYTLLSIIFAFISLIITIFSNHKRYSIISEQHKFTQNSYMHLAQRAREAQHPTINETQLIALYDDLERDFATLKVRGIEPQDSHFDKAHELFKKIQEDAISSEAQSYPKMDIKESSRDAEIEEKGSKIYQILNNKLYLALFVILIFIVIFLMCAYF